MRIWLILLTLISFAGAQASELTGRVISVHDGDTITVLDGGKTQHRIRLLGIDAPESGQAFGARSKQNLSGFVYDQTVHVEYQKRDRYQRILGKVYVPSQCAKPPCPFVDVNLVQIQAGVAWWNRPYVNDQPSSDRHAYELAEAEARDAGRGLWAARNPVAPWVWRRRPRGDRM